MLYKWLDFWGISIWKMKEDDGEDDFSGSSLEQSNLGNWFLGELHLSACEIGSLIDLQPWSTSDLLLCAHIPSMDMSHYYHQEENRFRGAAHAGSWYTSNGKTISLVKSEREGGDYSSWKNQTYITAPQLTADLLGWLRRVSPRHPGQQFPAIGCKGIIAPYDGFNHVLYDLTALSFVFVFFVVKFQACGLCFFRWERCLGVQVHWSFHHVGFSFFFSSFLSLSCPPSISTRFSFSRSHFKNSRRVFIFGPSHHWRIKTCALTRCHTYDTPIGTLPVDTASECIRLPFSNVAQSLSS